MRTVHLATLPKCCICDRTANYDSPIDGGSWGYLCTTHYNMHGSSAVASMLTDEPEVEQTPREKRRDLMAAIEAGDFDAAEDIIGDGDIAEWL